LGPSSGSTAINQFNGGLNVTTRTITTSYAIDSTATDYEIFANCSAPCTVTLPALTNGRTILVKDISGAATTNNITIAQHASENIEGVAASYLIQVSYGFVSLTTDATNWWLNQ
jgi:hypothetical protein